MTWRDSPYAEHYFEQESPYLSAGLKQAVGPKALQVGTQVEQSLIDDLDLPFLLRTSQQMSNPSEVRADPAFLPFSPDSFAMVIMPHVLERHSLPHQVLREAHRVLMPEGHIVLTGFNPASCVGIQRLVRPKAVLSGRYYTVSRVVDWLQLLGFEIVASSMYQYAPLLQSPKLRRGCRFVESIGDRWLPMFGGAYMITAKKREPASTLVGRIRFNTRKRQMHGATAPARASMTGSEKVLLTQQEDK
ncbi:class I SAM-dependent methyltransferase [Arenicella xantha]|uniref:Methyltransferase family protein n=1 Tax=Arenicella xantha TaxID=644221 RepID=A0A395JPY1_9GAMM|nr:methyltransferase domain-containing protein [Arenicella xantha]RBP51628.1 methyltransferase family protein [Arenicella xantha]